MLDCAIIGGGPAGLSAALVLGRARRSVALFDEGKPRNRVALASHGFLTRDGASPAAMRKFAHDELAAYPSVRIRGSRVEDVAREADGSFRLTDAAGESWLASRLLLATGLKELLPEIEGLGDFYGRSLFCCAYCDGWELRDRPLVLVAGNDHTFHLAKTVYNWSRDLLVCTNGYKSLEPEEERVLRARGIRIDHREIERLVGADGQLTAVRFADGEEAACAGGFVAERLRQAAPFAERLGCALTQYGGIETDAAGRTSVPGVYAAGDAACIMPAQLIVAAAEGSRAAIGINEDMTHEAFA
ncbi:NAD(P)/FAD-dependent oxidoreductase [Cohnella sp. JJ-181]|uniref:NAD(P)/FAD-dependent oxidoreductase n=1 Tax=Cohnella rhizoplanae TaxID=2974897 RepID=UPI0022FF951C|nr:NAD(P)/FAD-dependent oxidoreductase [Cohnella sp. JJ-181]CAI6086813.1 Thioredoxin reductase [Cohnella sp. JJ-181]